MTIRPLIKQDVYAEKSFIHFFNKFFQKTWKSGGTFICYLKQFLIMIDLVILTLNS